MLNLNQLYVGDAIDYARSLPPESVNCVMTSPPYFGQRDYGEEGQIGQESSPQEYIQRLVTLFSAVRTALHTAGTLWLNLGDGYAGSNGNGYTQFKNKKLGVSSKLKSHKPSWDRPAKNLLMIPARVALAMQDDGWILRSEIVWHKKNAMPENVQDRPTNDHEMIYLFAKSPRYWYDQDSERVPHVRVWNSKNGGSINTGRLGDHKGSMGAIDSHPKGYPLPNPKGANLRDTWSINTTGSTHTHFASFPLDIPRRCIRLGCPPDGVVLDPFMGSGTTAVAAILEGRQWIGSELNPEYATIVEQRLQETRRELALRNGATVQLAKDIVQKGMFDDRA